MSTQSSTPDHPGQLGKRSWVAVAKRTVKEFREDNLTDWAAALTYYAVLAIFPALIVIVSLLGLIGESATQPLIDNLGKVAPGPAQEIFTNAVTDLQSSQGTAGFAFVAGLAGALWSASGYTAAFMRASNAIYEVEEGRPIWKSLPVRVGVTLALVIGTLVCAVAVVFTGGLAEQAGNVIGLGDSAVTAWNIAKWPVLLLIVSLMFALLYWAAPNVKQPGFRWITAGGIFAVLIWVAASVAFAFYVANFGSYNKTYGALGGVISFLVWLWISNIAVLLGAEFNAELERGRQIEAGMKPTEREPFLPPRDTKKMDNPPDTSGIPDPTERGRKKDDDSGSGSGGDSGGGSGSGGGDSRSGSGGKGHEPRGSEERELRREDRPREAEGGGYEARPAAGRSGRVPGGDGPHRPGHDD
ncbi:MAG TPA: YihY/virulence factor BrkB family protein [Thermoleophilaceae bacterium]